tara:strand:+ start:2043 stop:2528 length:486 start_codon:yes stop_codon:yes gene_type:complete
MKRTGKRKKYPKRHLFDIGTRVIFRFAGKTRVGNILEKTFEEVGNNPKGHATYVIKSGKLVYPCVGVDGSKQFGNILLDDTKAGKILITKLRYNQYNESTNDKRGYNHLKLPKLKEVCKKHKLKVGGTKKELVERLEKWYYESSQCGVSNIKKVNESFFVE